MCIAAWIWQAHPLYRLLLVHNRDELYESMIGCWKKFEGWSLLAYLVINSLLSLNNAYFDVGIYRPTKPLEWWGEGGQKILGARDGLAGGTWLGCTRNGRLAFLTNFRGPDPNTSPRSRGDLPVRFLECEKSPLEFAAEVANEADEYNGFNLVLADIPSKSMVYVSNRPTGDPALIELVTPGLHVLSNAKLDAPWPKARRLGSNFKDLLRDHEGGEIPAKQMVEQLMRDAVRADRSSLPSLGSDPEWELKVSSIFVDSQKKQGRPYGTRSTTVLAVKTDGEVSFYEETLEGGLWKDRMVRYQIPDRT